MSDENPLYHLWYFHTIKGNVEKMADFHSAIAKFPELERAHRAIKDAEKIFDLLLKAAYEASEDQE